MTPYDLSFPQNGVSNALLYNIKADNQQVRAESSSRRSGATSRHWEEICGINGF